MQNFIHWSPSATLEQTEREHIQKTLAYHKGNKTATARSLGIVVRTLDAKLEQYAADAEAQKAADEARIARNKDFLDRSRGIAPAGQFSTSAQPPPPGIDPKPMSGINPTPPEQAVKKAEPDSRYDSDPAGFDAEDRPPPKKQKKRA